MADQNHALTLIVREFLDSNDTCRRLVDECTIKFMEGWAEILDYIIHHAPSVRSIFAYWGWIWYLKRWQIKQYDFNRSAETRLLPYLSMLCSHSAKLHTVVQNELAFDFKHNNAVAQAIVDQMVFSVSSQPAYLQTLHKLGSNKKFKSGGSINFQLLYTESGKYIAPVRITLNQSSTWLKILKLDGYPIDLSKGYDDDSK